MTPKIIFIFSEIVHDLSGPYPYIWSLCYLIWTKWFIFAWPIRLRCSRKNYSLMISNSVDWDVFDTDTDWIKRFTMMMWVRGDVWGKHDWVAVRRMWKVLVCPTVCQWHTLLKPAPENWRRFLVPVFHASCKISGTRNQHGRIKSNQTFCLAIRPTHVK